MKFKAWFVAALVVVGTVGCGSKPAEEPAAGDAGQQSQAPASGVSAEDQQAMAALPAGPVMAQPVDAVNYYLAKMKEGDDAGAELMMTRRARLEMSRGSYVVQPLSSPTARVEVGRTEVDPESPNGAYVSSTWSEEVPGQAVSPTYELVWILRSDSTEGWRIVGVATRIFDDQNPLILNFEEPEATHQRVQQAQAEMVARQEQAAAQQPADPNAAASGGFAPNPGGAVGGTPAFDPSAVRTADQSSQPPTIGQQK